MKFYVVESCVGTGGVSSSYRCAIPYSLVDALMLSRFGQNFALSRGCNWIAILAKYWQADQPMFPFITFVVALLNHRAEVEYS